MLSFARVECENRTNHHYRKRNGVRGACQGNPQGRYPTPYIPAIAPVMLKTPAHPVAIFAPVNIDIADWYVEPRSDGEIKAFFACAQQGASGFALAGAACADKQDCLQQISNSPH
jgi:hypothetical protein